MTREGDEVGNLGLVLALIAKRAPDLREAGIVGLVTVGSVSFTVAPAPGEEPAITTDDEEPGAVGVLNDPATHGVIGKDAPKTVTVKRRPI